SFQWLTTENPPMSVKISSYGTSPSRLFKDKLRFRRRVKPCRNVGIFPDKLLLEKSRKLRLFKALKVEGIPPPNKLSFNPSCSSIKHLAIVIGVCLDNLLLEISNSRSLLMFPIYASKGPLREF
ncbi:hypothetical protein U1Q18_003079, partial [Sarracenia purpurea var. burkii]